MSRDPAGVDEVGGFASGDLQLVLDSAGFSRLMKAVRGFDKDLAASLRKELRTAVKPAVDDVKRTLMQPTGHPESRTRLRRTLAAGTKVSLRTGARNAGVTITTSGAKLPFPRLAKLYNRRGGWRHPVFGDREVWKPQKGRPYFGQVRAHQQEMRAGVARALGDAVSHMGGAGR